MLLFKFYSTDDFPRIITEPQSPFSPENGMRSDGNDVMVSGMEGGVSSLTLEDWILRIYFAWISLGGVSNVFFLLINDHVYIMKN